MLKCPMHFEIDALSSAAPHGSLTERGALEQQPGHERCLALKPDSPSSLLHNPCCRTVIQAICCRSSMPSGKCRTFTSLCAKRQHCVVLLHTWLP